MFERLIERLLVFFVKLIWRTLVRPIFMAAFSPIVLGWELHKAKFPTGNPGPAAKGGDRSAEVPGTTNEPTQTG